MSREPTEWTELERVLRDGGSSETFIDQAHWRLRRALAGQDPWRADIVVGEILSAAGHTKEFQVARNDWRRKRIESTKAQVIVSISDLDFDDIDIDFAADYVERYLATSDGPESQEELYRLCEAAAKVAIDNKKIRLESEVAGRIKSQVNPSPSVVTPPKHDHLYKQLSDGEMGVCAILAVAINVGCYIGIICILDKMKAGRIIEYLAKHLGHVYDLLTLPLAAATMFGMYLLWEKSLQIAEFIVRRLKP